MSDENNKSTDQSTDPELDKLLDSALADFDKLSQPIEKKNDETITSSSETVKNLTDDVTDETWAQDFVKKTAERFGMNLQNTVQNGGGGSLENTLATMAKSVATAISNGSDEGNCGKESEFNAAIAQAFKDISATSENLQNASSGTSEADLAEMFGGVSLDESGEDILPFMQGMMQSLLSKEILYPTLKELADKYPGWLDEKKDTLSIEEIERYNKQLDVMKNVCTELEMENDDDTDDIKRKRFEKILGLMSDIQSFGAPPDDLVGDQTGLFQVDNEGNPKLPPGVDPQNCNIM